MLKKATKYEDTNYRAKIVRVIMVARELGVSLADAENFDVANGIRTEMTELATVGLDIPAPSLEDCFELFLNCEEGERTDEQFEEVRRWFFEINR